MIGERKETGWSGVRTGPADRAEAPKVPAGPYGSRARDMPGGKRSPREDLPLRFNVLEHQLVPEHRLVSEEEAERVLKGMKITRDQLPKIRKSDPVIQVLEKIEGPIEEGRIVRVTRASGTAGVSEAYRVGVGREGARELTAALFRARSHCNRHRAALNPAVPTA